MKDAFLFKAQENLAVAEWSYANGHFNACANRAYYAAFQAAVAGLAHFGFTYTGRVEHQNVQRHFATELSDKRKVFPGRLKSYLPTLQAVRDTADYQQQNLSKRVASKQLREAKEFIDSILQEINQ